MGGSDRRWPGLASFGGGGLWGLGYPGRSRMYSCSVSAAKPIAGNFSFFSMTKMVLLVFIRRLEFRSAQSHRLTARLLSGMIARTTGEVGFLK